MKKSSASQGQSASELISKRIGLHPKTQPKGVRVRQIYARAERPDIPLEVLDFEHSAFDAKRQRAHSTPAGEGPPLSSPKYATAT